MNISCSKPLNKIGNLQACESLPVSEGQKRLWFLHQLSPNSAAYHLVFGYRIQGDLAIEKLHKSIFQLLLNYPQLRSSFHLEDREVLQAILPAPEHLMEIQDLRTLTEEKKVDFANTILAEKANHPFDLSSGPLFRIPLLQTHDDQFFMGIILHHIISDGWSAGLFLKGLMQLYNGDSETLNVEKVPYSEFIRWQQKRVDAPFSEKDLTFWLDHLNSAPQVLELPVDRPRPPIRSEKGRIFNFSISPERVSQVSHFSRANRITTFTSFFSLFNILLYRYSGQSNLCIGLPVANRFKKEFESVIGFFANTMVIHSNLSLEMSLQKLVQETKGHINNALRHQSFPFERLVSTLAPKRSTSHTPLFQVMFAYQHQLWPELKLNELEIQSIPIDKGAAGCDLTWSLLEIDNKIDVTIEYSTELYEESRIRNMAEHFNALLDSAIEYPQKPISKLSILSNEERKKILTSFNSDAIACQHEETLVSRYESLVEKYPGFTAIQYKDQTLTFKELNVKANQMAYYLLSKKCKKESVIGILANHSFDLIIGILGVLKAGAAYLTLDPELPTSRLSFYLNDSRCSFLLVDKSLQEKVGSLNFKGEKCSTQDPKIEAMDSANPPPQTQSNNLAYMVYTSGSLGQPKGILIEHRAIINNLNWRLTTYKLSTSDRILQLISPSFDAFSANIFSSLLSGAQLSFVENPRDITHALATIEDQKITYLMIVPAFLSELVKRDARHQLNSVRLIVIGGEIANKETIQTIRVQYPQIQMANEYGPSETCVSCTTNTCFDEQALGNIGKPIANYQVTILDPFMELCPLGIPGELYIGGDGLARGYFNRHDEQRKRFIPSPFSDDKILYKTGDHGYWNEDGSITFLGRKDDQVKLRGFRIELSEIEQAIQAYRDVTDVTVLLNPSPQGSSLWGFIKSKNEISSSDLNDYLLNQLPWYMLPSKLIFLSEFPRTTNGKIDKIALLEQSSNVETKTDENRVETEYDSKLNDIWCNLLDAPSVPAETSFFDCGGNSFLAVELAKIIQKQFNTSFLVTDVFKYPTFSSQAEYLISALGNPSRSSPSHLDSAATRADKQRLALERQQQKQNHAGIG